MSLRVFRSRNATSFHCSLKSWSTMTRQLARAPTSWRPCWSWWSDSISARGTVHTRLSIGNFSKWYMPPPSHTHTLKNSRRFFQCFGHPKIPLLGGERMAESPPYYDKNVHLRAGGLSCYIFWGICVCVPCVFVRGHALCPQMRARMHACVYTYNTRRWLAEVHMTSCKILITFVFCVLCRSRSIILHVMCQQTVEWKQQYKFRVMRIEWTSFIMWVHCVYIASCCWQVEEEGILDKFTVLRHVCSLCNIVCVVGSSRALLMFQQAVGWKSSTGLPSTYSVSHLEYNVRLRASVVRGNRVHFSVLLPKLRHHLQVVGSFSCFLRVLFQYRSII